MSRYVHVEFLPKSRKYSYTFEGEVKVGDLVAVPPSWFKTEGGVGVVRGIGPQFGPDPSYKGEVKSILRVIPRSQWKVFGYDG